MAAKGQKAAVVVAALVAVSAGLRTVVYAEDAAYPYPPASLAGEHRPPPGHYPLPHGAQTAVDPIRLQSELDASRAELKRTTERLEAAQFLLQQAREALARNYAEAQRQRELQADQSARLAEAAALGKELLQERATNQQLRAQAASLAERQDITESEFRSCQDRLAALDSDLDTANTARIAAQETLETTQEERDRLRDELNDMAASLQEREGALARANASATAALAERDALQAQLVRQDADRRDADAVPAPEAGMERSTALTEQLEKTRLALDEERAAKTAMQQALADAVSTRERLLALLDRVNGRLADRPAAEGPVPQGQTAKNESQQQLQSCNERLAAAMVALSASAMPASAAAAADTGHPSAPPPHATDLAALESAVTDQPSNDRDADGIPDHRDLCPDSSEASGVDATGCVSDAPIALAGINFRYDSDALTEPSRAALDRIAGILLEQPALRLEIAGHTDAQGDAAYNLWLSEQRAKSVLAYLVDRGIPSARLTARGYGGTQPIAANSTREGLARNRRVELRRLP